MSFRQHPFAALGFSAIIGKRQSQMKNMYFICRILLYLMQYRWTKVRAVFFKQDMNGIFIRFQVTKCAINVSIFSALCPCIMFPNESSKGMRFCEKFFPLNFFIKRS